MTNKNLKKEAVKRAIMGFIYGVFIGQTILILESLAMRDGNFYSVTKYLLDLAGTKIAAVIIQYFLTGIIGTTFAATTVLFEIDSWSLLKQTIIHFIITSIVMYIAGFLCGWFPHKLSSTLIWFGIFIVIYVIFWISFSSYYKNKVKKMNEAL
jgi:hypothetical protein